MLCSVAFNKLEQGFPLLLIIALFNQFSPRSFLFIPAQGLKSFLVVAFTMAKTKHSKPNKLNYLPP